MKNIKSEMIAFILVLATTVGVIAGTVVYWNSKKPKMELIARAPERGNWYPRTITVNAGDKVTLTIRNVDAIAHGFWLPDFDISIGEIQGGEVKKIEFVANEKGVHPFYCAVWCGDYHMQMRGELIVR